MEPAACNHMETWDASMNMCMPLPMAGMPMSMLMIQGHAFATGISESGRRGRGDLASANMLMADLGTSVGESHYVNVDLMLTGERATFPYRGSPELLQIGESNTEGLAFVDAQHPHSSPIMGLTLSDTWRINKDAKNYLKFFFAPRGESTDGPIAFMHRPTGEVNPDAPLGHHVGQDVGHISSTVLGASARWGANQWEASVFDGTEPKPDAVDLPLGTPKSMAFRMTRDFSPQWTVMASVASVQSQEAGESSMTNLQRTSASGYYHQRWNDQWEFYNSIILGSISHLDHASQLSSLAEEFLFEGPQNSFWGRLEVLQRTPRELEIFDGSDLDQSQWVQALTLGTTTYIRKTSQLKWGLGASVTVDFLPSRFASAYSGQNPTTGKVFLQISGRKMWDLE